MRDTPKLIAKNLFVPFVLVVSLFVLWGFANDVTNPLVKAFEEVFLISSAKSGLVQTAFYGGYATMAIPAAIFIRRYSYKSGILLGLALYSIGAFLFVPASILMEYWMFLAALYVLTFGLAFLETTANPYILSMGDSRTATRRLNFAQAFNPIGSLTGMFVSKYYILSRLDVAEFKASVMKVHPELLSMKASEAAAFLRKSLETFSIENPAAFNEIRLHDLSVIRMPYVVIGFVVLFMFFVFLIKKMPNESMENGQRSLHLKDTFWRLAKNKIYVGGVVAQTFYIGAQIMCWTYIIHYAVDNLNMGVASAQGYNICAMLLFCSGRFACTYLLKFFNSGALLSTLAAIAGILTAGVVFLDGYAGLYCLILISGCMSLMFPTIYGIALNGLGDDAKLASAGLIFAIVGGALMPPLQGAIIDMGTVFPISGVRASFILPFICFVVVSIYGFTAYKYNNKTE